MSRTIRVLAVGLLVVAFATAASAQTANQRMEGMMGVGFYSSDAPVGVRYWMNDGMAVDFGVGFDVDTKNPNPGDGSDETLFDWAFDVGLPIVMHGEENAIVYFRPGATFMGSQTFDPATGGAGAAQDKVTDIAVNLGLAVGGEFFLTNWGWPNLSFSGQVGVDLEILSPGAEGADTDVNFNTVSKDLSVVNTGQLGFHIYF